MNPLTVILAISKGMTFLFNWRIWVALGLFVAGWLVNGWRLNSEFSDYKMAAEMASKAVIEQARKTEQKWNDKLNQERDNAVKREIKLRNDADLAHAASDGLRDQLSATAIRIAQAPASACIDYSTKLADVLGSCSQEYSNVAEEADRWENEAMMLRNAWPN